MDRLEKEWFNLVRTVTSAVLSGMIRLISVSRLNISRNPIWRFRPRTRHVPFATTRRARTATPLCSAMGAISQSIKVSCVRFVTFGDG
jgi:hypothetical protein